VRLAVRYGFVMTDRGVLTISSLQIGQARWGVGVTASLETDVSPFSSDILETRSCESGEI
jgi:hypothetical protein